MGNVLQAFYMVDFIPYMTGFYILMPPPPPFHQAAYGPGGKTECGDILCVMNTGLKRCIVMFLYYVRDERWEIALFSEKKNR